jgi:pimeloyl-ACP methyl ester carboxylesterase
VTVIGATETRTLQLPVDDVELVVEAHAENGPPLLLLHGGLSTPGVDWSEQLPHLRRRFTVYGLEQRGHGRSGLGTRPILPAVLARDAIGVMDRLGIGDAHVVGFSMGATAALEMARTIPERIRTLVVVGPQVGAPAPEVALAFRDEAAAWQRRLAPLHALGRWDVLLEQMTSWVNVELADLSALSSLPMRTMVVHGDRDPYVSPRDLAGLASGVRSGELLVVPNARHAAQIDGWEIVNAALDRFWAGGSAVGYG